MLKTDSLEQLKRVYVSIPMEPDHDNSQPQKVNLDIAHDLDELMLVHFSEEFPCVNYH